MTQRPLLFAAINLDPGRVESVGRPYSRIRHRCQQQHVLPTGRPSQPSHVTQYCTPCAVDGRAEYPLLLKYYTLAQPSRPVFVCPLRIGIVH